MRSWIAITGATALAGAALGAAPAFAAEAGARAGGPPVHVIVQATGSDAAAAVDAVRRAGGTVQRVLAVVDGVAATVPAGAVGAVERAPGVASVTLDGQVSLKGNQWQADDDVNSMYSVTRSTGALDVWKTKDAFGNLVVGQGVGVALIDSGVTPVKGLEYAGRVINGPDLSFESQAPNLRHLDTFGHGTHMAGIILGRDPELRPGNEDDPRYFAGMAPGANLINVKVATADGAVDVSQVIAAIDWVVAHRNDPGLNIRVLNLSFGTDSLQSAQLDPLSHAVESAWRKGIIAVVAVGNDGAAATTVSMPAANPYVIAVGAADSQRTEARGDDIVADFSSRGNAARHADLVAPGRSIVSLRDPSSYVDTNYPTGLVPGDKTGRFFRGSGSSQATAVVSGAVALLLQQRPALTPDQVKRLLMTTADAMPLADPVGRGAGQLNIRAAAAAATPVYSQAFAPSTGTGLLERSRGTAHVADPDTGAELVGERDIMGRGWSAAQWSAAASAGTSWSGGTWNGCVWTGGAWTGTSFATKTWASGSWAGSWAGTSWAGRTWSGRTWSGAVWDGRTWSGRTWSGRTWSGRTWSGEYWSASIWR